MKRVEEHYTEVEKLLDFKKCLRLIKIPLPEEDFKEINGNAYITKNENNQKARPRSHGFSFLCRRLDRHADPDLVVCISILQMY